MPRLIVQSDPPTPPHSQDQRLTTGKRKPERRCEDECSEEEPSLRLMRELQQPPLDY